MYLELTSTDNLPVRILVNENTPIRSMRENASQPKGLAWPEGFPKNTAVVTGHGQNFQVLETIETIEQQISELEKETDR